MSGGDGREDSLTRKYSGEAVKNHSQMILSAKFSLRSYMRAATRVAMWPSGKRKTRTRLSVSGTPALGIARS